MSPTYSKAKKHVFKGETARRRATSNLYSKQLEAASSFPMWLLLGTTLAPTINVFVGGTKLTLSRIGILCLLIPAISKLFSPGRRIVVSDWFGLATVGWMILATTMVEGFDSSAFAEALEFFGAYLVVRAYTFGPARLSVFVRVLKSILIVLVLLAALDTLSGRNITLEATANILPGVGSSNAYRLGLVRAASTFDGSTQFGTFCAAAAGVLFYSERTIGKRFIYGGLCILGCVLALSSAPLMGMAIVFSCFAYDHLLRQYSWRWNLLMVLVSGSIVIGLSTMKDPLSTIIGHLTFDPSDGWFRYNTWTHATRLIGLSPWLGYAFLPYGDPDDFFDQASVDCVWLVFGLRFGLPAVAFLLLMNISSFFVLRRSQSMNKYMDGMSTGLTLSVIATMFVGLTVHYWNGPWILWGIFIGVRASLKEYGLGFAKKQDRGMATQMWTGAASVA